MCHNMPWQSSEYRKYVRILNMASDYVPYNTSHEVTLQITEYLLRDVRIQNLVKDLKYWALWKKIIAFNYYCKTLHLKSLRGLCICVGFKYMRVLNMPIFSICQGSDWISWVTRCLLIFVNMTGFWISVGTQLWKGSEYSKFLHM